SVANVPDRVSRPVPTLVRVEPLLSVIVPPVKARVAPSSAFQVPELLPPLPTFSTPLCTSTVPLLFSFTPKVVVPADRLLLLSVPALTNTPLLPPLKLLSDWKLNVPVLVLVTVESPMPTVPVPVTFTVPLFVRVLLRPLLPPVAMVTVPLAGMTVVTATVPAFQVKLVGVKVPVPLILPMSL